ncbi:hypothetical protein B0J13DRAFT_678349 [Dactylonectria estremocensis]|uniref:Uncharacterized protein n=1 Tax=Dactylonectria estremocensis TaxID=1079267 RepID=A0A9P9EB55_9HYPO|nr:hypothetical protein B0J13DRAFT_678349 [Dactylonectria estremocensis]
MSNFAEPAGATKKSLLGSDYREEIDGYPPLPSPPETISKYTVARLRQGLSFADQMLRNKKRMVSPLAGHCLATYTSAFKNITEMQYQSEHERNAMLTNILMNLTRSGRALGRISRIRAAYPSYLVSNIPIIEAIILAVADEYFERHGERPLYYNFWMPKVTGYSQTAMPKRPVPRTEGKVATAMYRRQKMAWDQMVNLQKQARMRYGDYQFMFGTEAVVDPDIWLDLAAENDVKSADPDAPA